MEARLRSKDLELLTMEEKFKTALHAKQLELKTQEEKHKSTLINKDNELRSTEDRYKSYMAKAKTLTVLIPREFQIKSIVLRHYIFRLSLNLKIINSL